MKIEQIFLTDSISKRERVEHALNHESLDRVPIHDQLSYNPNVIAALTDKPIKGFDYTIKDIGMAVSCSLDMTFPIIKPRGTETITDEDGFVYKNDRWTTWHISRPFDDTQGALDWLKLCIKREKNQVKTFNKSKVRKKYHNRINKMQQLVGDTVIFDYPAGTGFCSIYDKIGLGLFSYLAYENPALIQEFIQLHTENAIRFVRAAGDNRLSPVVLIAEDFATKQGSIFSSDMLKEFHLDFLPSIVDAWHEKGMIVIYHSDGNYKKNIPSLIDCGVDGFYCLEPNCNMNIVELKQQWPSMVWMGGVDGVDLMERGAPSDVFSEVQRQISLTKALSNGGVFIGSSSEINPSIPAQNFIAMINAVGETL